MVRKYRRRHGGEASGGAADAVLEASPEPVPSDSQTNARPSPPGIQYPEGIRTIDQVDEEFKEKQRVLSFSEEVRFEPSCIRLAMPETEKEAKKDIEMLESYKPPAWEDLDGMQREIINDRGEKTLNVNWIRAWVKKQKEDDGRTTKRPPPQHSCRPMPSTRAQNLF